MTEPYQAAYERLLATAPPNAEVGVIVRLVRWEWVLEHDERVKHLGADVDSHFGLPPKPNPDDPLGIWPVLRDWKHYHLRWTGWRTAHVSEWSRMGNEPWGEFGAFKVDFNELLRRFQKGGGGTDVAVVAHKVGPGAPTWLGPATLLGVLFGVGYLLRGLGGLRR
jgi:hypothetical protein